jgi:Glycosyl transferase family 2
MAVSIGVPLERPFEGDIRPATEREPIPVLADAKLPSRQRVRRWLLPMVDLLAALLALAVVVPQGSADLVVIPFMLIAINGAIGVYESRFSRGVRRAAEGRARDFLVRLLVGICFAWATALLVPLEVDDQLLLWVCFVVFDTAGRIVGTRLIRRATRIERWVLVGDEVTAERLVHCLPLRKHATIVCAVLPPIGGEVDGARYRNGALEVVDRYRADRVVIATKSESDHCLLALVRAFRAVGVPVSLLPQPLDLVDAPAATPRRIGGVPLIEVEALAAHDAVPYRGPDRRIRDRRPKVTVVIPAMNEERNIGLVLSQLPADLHEVILVDGNSTDETVKVAEDAYPGIRVVTQTGKGKGDALRSGFAAVSGNLIVMLDADGSADPREIPRFVAALESGADFAKGSRFIEGGGSADITTLRRVGNSFLSLTVNTLHRTSFTDLCYGYNAFWTRCLPHISLDVPGFEVETHINLRVASAGMRITEVPSYERDRMYGQSNLNTFRDGFRVLRTIFHEARRNQIIRRGRAHHGAPGANADKVVA